MLRKSAGFAGFLLIAVSAFGQYGTQWRTAADIQEGVRGTMIGTVTGVNPATNTLTLLPDGSQSGMVTVTTDALTTQYNGFGGVINGSPEIFMGSAGFANVRVGDRLDIRGTGQPSAGIAADRLLLVGRPIPADQTGVGQTRPPSSISIPSVGSVPASTAPSLVEGVVREVNAGEQRVVIETDMRRMITVRGTRSTPVHYHDGVYRIANLEAGDRIRINVESTPAGDEVRARSIDVVRSVQESEEGETPQPEIGSVTGKVTSIDRRNDMVRVDTGRGEVRINLSQAEDDSGHEVHAADMQVGDHIDLSGSYNGETFVATTVRYLDNAAPTPAPASAPPAPPASPAIPAPPAPPAAAIAPAPLGAVTIYGTVTQTLSAAPQLSVHDDQSGQTIRLYVLDDFVVRTKEGGYTTAGKLARGDAVIVVAYRDSDRNYIAQSIRLR